MPIGLAPLAFLVANAIPGSLQQKTDSDYVPVETRNYRDLSLPFLKLDPRPWILQQHEQTLTVGFSAANDIRKMPMNGVPKLYEDYENDIVTARYRQGLGHGLDFTLDGTMISRGGGFLDPIIDAWHHIIGLVNNVRTGVPYGQCVIDIPGSGPYHDAIGIGDISGAITKELTPRLMGTLAIKVPTGNAHQILGSGNFDGAFDFQYRIPAGNRWMCQFQAGLVGQGASTELASTRGLNPQGAIVLMHKANKVDSYVFQWQSEESGTVTGIAGSDSAHTTLTFGYQRHFVNGRMLELYISDDGDFVNTFHDPVIANIGPEPTIGVRYLIKF